MFPTSSRPERGSIPIDLIDPSSFPALMSTRDVNDDKRQQRSNNVDGSAHNVGNQPHVPLICPIAPNAATNNDDDNGNANNDLQHERQHDDVNNDDDDDVSRQAKPSSYVGSLGRGCASLTASGAPEGEGIDELGGQLDQSPPHVQCKPFITSHSQRPSSGCELPTQSVKADVSRTVCAVHARADPGLVCGSHRSANPSDQYASTSTGADRGSVVGLD